MTSGGGTGPPPPNSGGEFLLQLLQKPKQQQQPPLQTQNPPPPHHHYLDPAVAAVGPTLTFQSNGHNHNHHPQQSPPQWLNHPAPSNTPWGLAGLPPPPNLHSAPDFPRVFDNKFQQLDANGGRLQLMPHRQEEKNMNMNMMMFGSLPPHFNDHRAVGPSPSSQRGVVEPRKTPPPGFHQKPKNFRKSQGNVDHASNSRLGLSGQLDHPGPPGGSKLWSVPASDIEESLTTLHEEHGRRREEVGQMSGNRWKDEQDGRLDRRRGGGSGSGSGPASKHRWKDEENKRRDEASGPSSQMGGPRWKDDLSEQLMNSVRLSIGLEKNARNNGDTHDTESKSDLSRELQIPGHRMRNHKRIVDCRSDIDKMNAPFLAIFDSLVPAEEEKEKQKQLLASLEKLVSKEWPTSQLYLYGSCANSFGVSKSDIDVCLAIKGEEINKSELLLRLADILKEDNLENVQALTHARVPIVKLMDPVTGISCDICVNNVLAVVNTKLLRDYAEIDCRLRQLAFIVKHWAKSRGVNVTYQGTLSSYAYVLMCIHFLQQRRPAILPCLQGMEATYVESVEDIKCSYFDKVENLRGFGAQNKESIAQLVWAFFDYWAYRHDYSNAVISVRTGSIISKRAKDWTRRIGNDRHLICIEDPFEISHDLGRVVDKYSIKILRDEFHRAAHIMQYDPDPCVTLFEPCVPEP